MSGRATKPVKPPTDDEVGRLQAAVAELSQACETLMGEVVGKCVTDWGVVNDALLLGGSLLPKGWKPKRC